jgi:DNA helicase-2/ATP-dependent DNA helicase PcrA
MEPEALLDGLDEEQRRAVTSSALPLVVLAPAGSGKTRVLTRRIAYRVATGEADPRHVLALTFTRKAAGELTDRLRRLGLRGESTAGTFHAVAWGVLRTRWLDERREAPTLLDRKGRLLVELAPKVPGRSARTVAGDLATEIEWAKARMITPDTYAEAVASAGRRTPLRAEVVAEVYAAYERRKQRGGLVDFDDLLGLCARAIESDERFATAQRWRFRHLFVDELQDVNPLQFRLLEAWRGDRYDVTAVGDPQQAIYGWNGADAGFLLDIHRHWPPAQVVQLVTSYRSTPQILQAAATVLRAARQPAQEVRAVRGDGTAPHLAGHPTDRDEAVAVARAVRLAHAPGRPWSEQAILVRTHAQTVLLAEALRESGIPHRLRGGAAFLDRPEIRRALREMRMGDEPLGTALADLEASIDPLGIEAPVEEDDDLATADLEARAEAAGVVAALVRMGRDYLRLDPQGRTDSFVRWLQATVQSEGDAGGGTDAVDLATFHAAKGLEWAVVHLAGIEDGYVPISHARTAAARAEEARLLYVAMTRAQRELRISWADTRTFASRVVDRRRSPLLDPLIATYRPEATRPLAATGPISPPVEDFADQVADQRAALATLQRAGTPGLEELHRWRDVTARAARVEPDAVLPDHVLARIARVRPADLDALGDIRGVGAILAQRFGPAMLAALHDAPAPGDDT